MEIVKLFMTPNKDLYDKTLDDVFDEEFYKIATSGSTGRRCLLSRSGTAHWR